MSLYLSITPIVFIEDPDRPPMTPEDVALITSILSEDLDEMFSNINNRISDSYKETLSIEQFSTLRENTIVQECPICFTEKDENITLNCEHDFCKVCIKRWLTEKINTCPVCRKLAI